MDAPLPPHLLDLQDNLKRIFLQIANNDAQSLRETIPDWSFVLAEIKREYDAYGQMVLTSLDVAAADEMYSAISKAYADKPQVVKYGILPRLNRQAQEAICYGASREIISSLDEMLTSTRKAQWTTAKLALTQTRALKDLMLEVFRLHGGKIDLETDLYMGLIGVGTVAEEMIKVLQFHMLATAPPETVRAVWAGETAETVYVYAPLMRKFATARGDADVIQVVAALTKDVPELPSHLAKALKSLGPKR